MTKIVYNGCYGGFRLSHDAIMRYAEIKGITLWPEQHSEFRFITYWTVPPDKRDGVQSERESTLYDRDIPRNDPALAQVVEELGKAANGPHAELYIRELAPGTQYRIDEYDGSESVMTPNDYEWSTA